MQLTTSERLFSQAKQIFPGGVNSPVRAFGSVGGTPPFITKANGPHIWDADGNQFIDYVGAWGPAILGHAHPEVVAAVQEAAARGLSFGAPTEGETALALQIQEAFPSMEKMRLVSSGTEACMSALRLARAFTGRTKILKFTGCYHGHADMLLVAAGSGVATFSLPSSAGVPAEAVAQTVVVPFNDAAATAAAFQRDAIAAVIIEPIVGNAGFIRPRPGFLEELADICRSHGALLIFDEVMTGFRVAWGGVQALHRIRPDLTTLGKVIGGGMPLAAYGGRADILAKVAPEGPMYQAGTLSGNPVAVACGRKTLEVLKRKSDFKELGTYSRNLIRGLGELAKSAGLPFVGDSEGGMFGFFFANAPVHSYEEARGASTETFRRFFHGMLQRGVYLAPSAFEAGFVSLSHSEADLANTLEAARQAFQDARQ